MHEMAITQSVVDAVCEHAAGRRVHSVKLEVGELCAVVPDSMQFCFELATQGTVADGALPRCRGPARRGPLPDLSTAVRTARPDPAVPVRKCRRGSPGRPRPADPLDGSELTMCATCGCGDDSAVITLAGHDHNHDHDHDHDHDHHHDDGHTHTETISLEQKVLAKNDLLADAEPAVAGRTRRPRAQRHQFAGRGQDDPSRAHHPRAAGRPAGRRHRRRSGDVARRRTNPRRRRHGRCRSTPARAATSTQTWCIAHCMRSTPSPPRCCSSRTSAISSAPALFDLGERSKVVVISVTEGADKPLKYPHMFAAAGLVLINKIDLLPYVDFDLEKCCSYARSVNPGVNMLPLSATTGEGVQAWYDWIASQAGASANADMSRRSVDKTNLPE